MTRIIDDCSIVAVDPTSRGLAFVVFENGELLDWGTRRKDGQELAVLDRLLDRYKAEVLVLEDPDAPRSERRPRIRRLLRSLQQHGLRKGIVVLAVCRYAVREEWRSRGLRTKQEVAGAIAEIFPELAPLVPRRRKVYNSEEARGRIFDAASLVLSVFDVPEIASRTESGSHAGGTMGNHGPLPQRL